jgi:hypothetical protein
MPAVFNNIYRFEWELGKGGFGTVFLAREDGMSDQELHSAGPPHQADA